ncbi:hypothetical protein M501DRAFT_927503 [Patellaria atrata CBS 101060]|uniref:CST complex subunit Ten1 n=1 Tax=Patellaria atrata CBS 101060 TaxID=1346257 RepID=A0A9P4SI37_9PEZI|nr:hypothetical protein M501DRAFT_927503 [Patellaria atrata CBS 101060]
MATPVPSRTVFLSDLQHLKAGDKVRFLGVECYTVQTGTLTLQHNYPPSTIPVTAVVNIDHVLESVKSMDLRTGAWLNIIGYVSPPEETPRTQRSHIKAKSMCKHTVKHDEIRVNVQAIILWPTGSLDIVNYETALEARKQLRRT